MSPEDIILWPDGDWCLLEDLEDYSWKSDDYEVLKEGTEQHSSFVWAVESMDPEEFREFINSPDSSSW